MSTISHNSPAEELATFWHAALRRRRLPRFICQMRHFGIIEALATDQYFEQAGFVLLPHS